MNKDPSKFESLFHSRSLRGSSRECTVPDQAVRWNLIGGLLFAVFWWIPFDMYQLHEFFHGGVLHIATMVGTLLLILFMLGSVWFFFLDVLCGMSGGGKTSFRIAVTGAVVMALACCVRVAALVLSWDPTAPIPAP